jgi:hypothetical protein
MAKINYIKHPEHTPTEVKKVLCSILDSQEIEQDYNKLSTARKLLLKIGYILKFDLSGQIISINPL